MVQKILGKTHQKGIKKTTLVKINEIIISDLRWCAVSLVASHTQCECLEL